MTQVTEESLKLTPLHDRHRDLGARMVEFGGWEMPLQYSSISNEHLAVRNRAGLFDVSHMGEIEIAGNDALAAVQRISTNDAGRLEIGQIQYSALTTHAGTFVDDLLVYRLAESHYLLVVNAANVAKDFSWIKQEIAVVGDAVAVNSSSRYALLALQGPCAVKVLQSLTTVELDEIRYYWFANGEVANVRATISRTGYTGEDGFEIFVPPQSAEVVWNALLEAGENLGLIPAGLGARDTLRLEASMRLSGIDMDESNTVLEAGLGWVVGWNKPSFNGREVLLRQKNDGLDSRIVGFQMMEKGIGRKGYDIFVGEKKVGVVSSGTFTPYLKRAIGMGYVSADVGGVGAEISIAVRGRRLAARVVKMPFYRRSEK